MSGMMLAAFAGLLMQQAPPRPSTLEPYQAPAIRPFEPTSDFGRETPQGDGGTELHRGALGAPVMVDAYVRSYEFTPTDAEAAYEQGVASAEIRADQTAGPLDGAWVARDARGQVLLSLVLDDTGRAAVEGGWRRGARSGPAIVENGALRLEGLGSIPLERAPDGWRGALDGRPVTLSRPN